MSRTEINKRFRDKVKENPERREERLAYGRAYMAARRADPKDYETLKAATRKCYQDRKNKTRAMLADFKKNGCLLCPEKEPVCLAAHHVDPKKKSFSVGRAAASTWKTRRMADELAKCVCLCHNCHMKVHHGKARLP